MGSVSPLIAIHQQLTKNNQQKIKDYQVLWLGTMTGPERKIVEKEGIEFKAIAAGKLRRYFDLRNIIDLAKIKIGFWQAFFIILK
ncbi:MAG: UDP-N-acetylglucosamine--N-acetylmuramyl-(pentapeptide) pyrophosphoryl-undecaprenol N-acetylglucosamine transferase, partial [Candidatus Aenigmatarchaeota archaeon]